MKKIFQLTSILALLPLLVFSCAKNEVDTDQYDTSMVVLQAYGPQPVVRGGTLRFVGSNLDKVVSVTIPEDNVITDIEVVSSGVHSEIRVTVPKETAAPGYPVLTLADGKTITGKTMLTYSEPITLESFSPAEILPGEVLTIQGDYLNLIHEVVFSDDPVADLVANNLPDTMFNHKIEFDLIIKNFLYEFGEFNLGGELDIYYGDNYYNSVLTGYEISKSSNQNIISVHFVCGLVRKKLTQLLTLGKV